MYIISLTLTGENSLQPQLSGKPNLSLCNIGKTSLHLKFSEKLDVPLNAIIIVQN